MRGVFIALLACCSLIANAQNQIVRRQGTKKPTRTTSATSRNSTIKKEVTTQPVKQTSPTFKASFSNGVLTVNGIRYEMAKVEAGTFIMGATPEMANVFKFDDEKPIHQVILTKNYFMGKTEVTQALWEAVMSNNPSIFQGANKPVELVSWDECQTFISKLNAATGRRFRLPTEAEWEFAARGGNYSHHYQYSGSNSLYEVAWFGSNSGNTTHDVATKQPNELGLYDMSGNVWEWCSDWYGGYSSSSQTNPTGARSGYSHVFRGGYYNSSPTFCRSSTRNSGISKVGFRLALSE